MHRLSVLKTVTAMVALFLICDGTPYADEGVRRFSDPAERSLEAGSVELIQNADGVLVEVRVADCELCDRTSYLPRRNVEVEISGEGITKEDFSVYSGRPGSIVFNEKDYMVFGVYYWGARSMEDNQ
ncbi:hypothetical protein [Marinobacter segnicrescens]|uniref:hypothetical protein n=1 Tax=Marinobacter segnicrescens TaxID=430453 RepID=UPI003A920C20